jgi:hypothetical protein
MRVIKAMTKKVWVIAGSVLLAFAIGVAFCAYATTLRAERFMRAIWKLAVGSTQTSAILAIADQFRSNLTDKSAVCDAENCSMEFSFENPLLKVLRCDKRSRLDAALKIKDHRIGYVYTVFGVGGGPIPSSVVNVIEFADAVPGGFRLDVLPRGKGGLPQIFVRFDQRASDSQKESIFDLKLSCLNRPFRCRTAYDLAPSLSKRPEARNLMPS